MSKSNPNQTLIDDILFVNDLAVQSSKRVVLSHADQQRLIQILKNHHKECKAVGDISIDATIKNSEIGRIQQCLMVKLLDKKIKGKSDEFLDPMILKLTDDSIEFLLYYSIFERVVKSRHYVRQHIVTSFGWLVHVLVLLLVLLSHIEGDRFMFVVINLFFLNYMFYFFTSLYQYRKNMRVIKWDIAQYGGLIGGYLVRHLVSKTP